ncbi:hypothetical protein [Olleya sp. YS]|uniref:hypothetical protein n=1 Tax=Olleya sp. YS TaxID=3028318 RepID=UPI00243410DC|nr:hypothetical protein [Olleya sp. YS]WGD35217.1 hypothetical protein Ollyesu_02095 [Olleya sp. YS]
MNLKRGLRLVALVLFIAIACVLPFPMTFKRKDNLPKDLIEQIDKTTKTDEEDVNKEAFN